MKSFVLVVLCLAAVSAHHGVPHEHKSLARHMDKELRANMNEYFDNVIKQMRIFMLEHDMVPMPLPDSMHDFSVDLLLFTWHGELYLTNGVLSGLTTIHRQGDSDLSYEDGVMIITADIGFDLMEFEYDFLAHIMDIGPDGRVHGVVQGLTLRMSIVVDLFGGNQELKELEVLNLGNLKVWLTGSSIIDEITNAIIEVITYLYQDSIVEIVVAAIKEAINGALEHTDPPTPPPAPPTGNIVKLMQMRRP